MAIGYCDTSKITAIADSIRSKTGKTETMNLDSMPTEIKSISVGDGQGEIIVTKSTSGGSTNYSYSLLNLETHINYIKNYEELNDGRKCIKFVARYKGDGYLSKQYAQQNTLMSSYDYYSNYTSVSYLSADKIVFKNMNLYMPSLCSIAYSSSSSYSISKGNIGMIQFDNCSIVGNSMYRCFSDGIGYNKNTGTVKAVDFGNLDTSTVTEMTYMFYGCVALTSLTLSPDWGINAKITSFDLSACPLTHDSCLDVFNKLADKTKTATTSATLTLNSTTKGLMSADEIKIATGKGWTVS